jgi:hypothetical protein
LKGAAYWVAEHELWLLAVPVTLMLFFGRLPLRIIGASLLLIPVPWVCRWAAKGYLTVHTPMDLPIVVLLIMALVGLYPSVDLPVSTLVLYQMIVEFALFYGLVNSFHSERRIWAIVAFLLLSGLGVSLLGLVGTESIARSFALAQDRDFSALLGGYGEFLLQLARRLNEAGFNANIVGGTLAMIFPLAPFLDPVSFKRSLEAVTWPGAPFSGGYVAAHTIQRGNRRRSLGLASDGRLAEPVGPGESSCPVYRGIVGGWPFWCSAGG